jgi:hypothetical protein
VTPTGLDARDRLTTVLLLSLRKTGIHVPEHRFHTPGVELADLIRDVREDLQALEGQLAACEEQARKETRMTRGCV